MARFTLHAVAPNQPGIVAAVAQSLAELGCNLEDCRMSVLHGQFSIVLILEAPLVSSGTGIEEALAPHLEAFALQLLVRPIHELAESDPGRLVMISAHGADHPGMVAQIALAISATGGDIVELVGHVGVEDTETPSHIELTVAIRPDALPHLRAALDALAQELEVVVTCSQLDE